jgi:hypothetical protein
VGLLPPKSAQLRRIHLSARIYWRVSRCGQWVTCFSQYPLPSDITAVPKVYNSMGVKQEYLIIRIKNQCRWIWFQNNDICRTAEWAVTNGYRRRDIQYSTKTIIPLTMPTKLHSF